MEASILRGFPGTSTFFLTVCPALRDLCASATPDRDQLTDAAELLSGQIGIGYQSWKTGCISLGRFEAAVAVIVMATRKDQANRSVTLMRISERWLSAACVEHSTWIAAFTP